ncbi:MAG: hypothetical protein JSS89_00515 [Bacteroidetes bacterium]|nr:hypothetical protein [Bacteroidota bacterium]
MNTSAFDSDSFLREHLPSVRATDEFEGTVLALAALHRLPNAASPEDLEAVVVRRGRRSRRLRIALYGTLGLGLLSLVTYVLTLQMQPGEFPASHVVQPVPSLVIPSEVTPPAEVTPIDPVIMQRVEARFKKPAQAAPPAHGVAGY